MKRDKTKGTLIEQLKRTPIVQMACERVGVGRASYYRWRKEDKEFARAADEALLEGSFLINDMAESQLISSIKDRNMAAIVYWLRHHHPSYANKLEIEGHLKHSVEELSAEEKALLTEALKLALPESPKENETTKPKQNN